MGEVEKAVKDIAKKIVLSANLRLHGVEYVREEGEWFLRVYIDRDGGIRIEDCVLVSKQLSKILDEQKLIDESYRLEVSSPGISEPESDGE